MLPADPAAWPRRWWLRLRNRFDELKASGRYHGHRWFFRAAQDAEAEIRRLESEMSERAKSREEVHA